MAITLVPKYVRAVAEQLNAYYRVLRGTDPDSIDLRLNGGGHFIVHHSGTNAAVFTVTDAGATGAYQPGDITNPDLADGAVTSAKIADDTIVNADINAGANIAVSKLLHVGAGNVIRSNGTTNVAGQVASGDIADQAIMDADVNAGANIAVNKLAHVGAGNVLKSDGVQNVGGPLVAADIPNGSITSAKILDNEIVNGDINSAANIAVSKLVHVGAGNVIRSNGTTNVAGQVVNADIAPGSITSAKILDDEIVNGDINSAANIAVSKLLHVGAGNVIRSNGTANVAGQVVNADIAPAGTANIAANKLAAVAAGQILKDVGSGVVGGGLLVDANVAAAGTANVALNKLANVTANQIVKDVGSGVVGGGLLVDANVAAAGTANVALGKLAPGAAGVLKSNGTAISAGNAIVTGDMAINTINGDRITDATIAGAKILGGAPPPNGAGVGDAYKVYATGSAGTTVSLQQVAAPMIAIGAVPQYINSVGPIGANTVNFDFTGISQAYKSLRLVIQGRSTVAAITDTIALHVSNVFSALYYGQLLYATAASPAAQEENGLTYNIIGVIAGNTAPAGATGDCVVDFPNYALGSVLVKTWVSQGGATWAAAAGGSQVRISHGTLFSAVPITQLTINPLGGQWMPGSYAALYGMN